MWAKSPKKTSEGVCFFVNLALKIQSQVVKNTLNTLGDFVHWDDIT